MYRMIIFDLSVVITVLHNVCMAVRCITTLGSKRNKFLASEIKVL